MKIRILILLAFVFTIMACENQEFIADDFGTERVFFPFQRPVRTLIQGKYDLGFNDNDNLGRFEIGVRMSGVVINREDRKVSFELAEDLIDAAVLGVDTVNVQVLPASYYTIEQESPVTIPAGSTDARIPIQLNDAFFDDPLSFASFEEVNYVIPLRITAFENLDSLLTGVPIVANPIKIVDEHWNPTPKDYTLFGIKFINKYHGKYLRRGRDVATNNTNGNVITTTYRNEFVVRDEIVDVFTSGRSNVTYSNRVRRDSQPNAGTLNLELSFDADDMCTVLSTSNNFNVSGQGRLVENGDEWGGEPRDVIYLEYQYNDPVNDETHVVNDTLVIRNRDVKFEEFTIDLER